MLAQWRLLDRIADGSMRERLRRLVTQAGNPDLKDTRQE